jgi:PAS domain-containing protein
MKIDFQVIADSSPDGVLVVSHSGTIVYLNAESVTSAILPTGRWAGRRVFWRAGAMAASFR